MGAAKPNSWFTRTAKATSHAAGRPGSFIQNTQNRDAEAVQVKLDELLRTTNGAHNALLDLENMEEEDLERLRVPAHIRSRPRQEIVHADACAEAGGCGVP